MGKINKKILVRGLGTTQEYINKNQQENILIINVGQVPTFLGGSYETTYIKTNFTEINVMLADVDSTHFKKPKAIKNDLKARGYWNSKQIMQFKFKIIQDIFETALKSKLIETIIIRCDAGASRSQAIATGLSRKYNLKIDGNTLVGNLDILQQFEIFLGIEKDRKYYEKLFKDKLKEIENSEISEVFIND